MDSRMVCIDGAVEWFAPHSGQRLRVDGPELAALRLRAPRSVQFALTNHCNLACSFCSRPQERRSTWTVGSALEVLADLDRLGVAEVAFGGGEPLAFRGFFDLVDALVTHTRLVVHLTTNGVLLDEHALARLRGRVGEIRLSLYEDNDWRRTLTRLVDHGVRHGVNVLVTPERLPVLESLLDELDALGCRDVLLLPAMGVPALELSPAQVAELGALLARRTWAFPLKLGVCWGVDLDGLERLFPKTDCGAGREFLEVTSDRHIRPCSFHRLALPFESAAHAMALWRDRQPTLRSHAGCAGCTRGTRTHTASSLGEATRSGWTARTYNAFASNNSGSYSLVGRFETSERAAEVAELLSALVADMERADHGPNPLQALLRQAGIDADARVGRSDDWPDRSYSPAPEAVHVDRQVWWFAAYTISMPAAIGEWVNRLGGRVDVELDHAHHPLLAVFSLWPDLPWEQRGSVDLTAAEGALWTGPLARPDVRARVRATPWNGLELLWLAPSLDDVRALMAHCRAHGFSVRLALSEAHRDEPDLDALWGARDYEDDPDDPE